MRRLIIAIVLGMVVVTLGAVPVDARAPATAERWGCRFEAELALIYGSEEGDWWIGAGEVVCDLKQTFTVRMALLRDTPGTPDRLVNSDTWVVWDKPGESMFPESLKLPGGLCVPGGPPPYPIYFRMHIERKGEPGALWLTTPNGMNPCDRGTWPRLR